MVHWLVTGSVIIKTAEVHGNRTQMSQKNSITKQGVMSDKKCWGTLGGH